uniref:Putative secreted protein n=1 Tax=Anopheles darlingi TaxID=43151 RepID=A0A2M4DBP6_ANODA
MISRGSSGSIIVGLLVTFVLLGTSEGPEGPNNSVPNGGNLKISKHKEESHCVWLTVYASNPNIDQQLATLSTRSTCAAAVCTLQVMWNKAPSVY